MILGAERWRSNAPPVGVKQLRCSSSISNTGLFTQRPQRSKTDRFDSPFQVYTLVVSMHVPAYLKKRQISLNLTQW